MYIGIIVTGNSRANASNFVNYSLLLFWLFRSILFADCLCLPQAGGLRSGFTTACSPFSGAPSPQKIPNKLGAGLNEVVHLGTGGRLPTFLFAILS
jgi:hypothetical protein